MRRSINKTVCRYCGEEMDTDDMHKVDVDGEVDYICHPCYIEMNGEFDEELDPEDTEY